MSNETAWANEQEWKAECGVIEIIKEKPAKVPAVCCATRCTAPAIVNLTIAPEGKRYGIDLDFCKGHADDWDYWYEKFK